jgi:hypothetical protein
MKTASTSERRPELTFEALPPERPIQGPKLPRHLAVIPEWVEPGQSEAGTAWSAEAQARLAAAVEGTTPIGRELIQKMLRSKKKHSEPSQEIPLAHCLHLLREAEVGLLRQVLAETDQAWVGDNLWRVDYRRKPPMMEEFLTDAYYLGGILHPDRSGGLWPVWFRTLCEEFDRDSFLHNVVLTGALGIGKTTVMVIILLYRICLLLLLNRPAEMFEQGAGAALYFVVVSVTREAAQQTGFHQAVGLMRASRFFRQTCALPLGHTGGGGEIELAGPENNDTHTAVYLTAGSKAHHLIGRNIVGDRV